MATTKRSIAVRIAGQEYRILADENDEDARLQRVAKHVDDAMQRIRERTDTVDSLDIAVLTALNLARQLLDLRESLEGPGEEISFDRLRYVIDLAESALDSSALDTGALEATP